MALLGLPGLPGFLTSFDFDTAATAGAGAADLRGLPGGRPAFFAGAVAAAALFAEAAFSVASGGFEAAVPFGARVLLFFLASKARISSDACVRLVFGSHVASSTE